MKAGCLQVASAVNCHIFSTMKIIMIIIIIIIIIDRYSISLNRSYLHYENNVERI